jgi:hypothetical protein
VVYIALDFVEWTELRAAIGERVVRICFVTLFLGTHYANGTLRKPRLQTEGAKKNSKYVI